jgi:hypothetical protein
MAKSIGSQVFLLMAKLWILLLCVAGVSSQAQVKAPALTDVAPPSDRFPASWYPPDSNVASTFAPQRGAPYTATLVTSWQFRDQLSRKEVGQTTFQARDGAGRTQYETNVLRPDGHGGSVTVHNVTVDDPVSHCAFRWTEPLAAPDKPTAIVACTSRTLHYVEKGMYADMMIAEPKEEQSLPNVIDRSEPLGSRVIEGLEAVGMRHTRITTDPQTHKSASRMTDIWYSPGLQEILEMRQLPDEQAQASSEAIRQLIIEARHCCTDAGITWLKQLIRAERLRGMFKLCSWSQFN